MDKNLDFKVLEEPVTGKLEYTDMYPCGRVRVGDTIELVNGNKYTVSDINGPLYDPFTFKEVHAIIIFDERTKENRKVNEKEIVKVIHNKKA